MTAARPRVAVLVSGRGSNLSALLSEAGRPGWPGEIALVVSNVPGAGGLAIAEAAGVPTVVHDHRPYGAAGRRAYDARLVEILRERGVDWVVLAGFLRVLSDVMIDAFPLRIVNVHPSLLPKFPGLHTHRRALEAGEREHGCSVHLVDRTLDGGPLLAQARVPVLPGDTEDALAARVLAEEHRLLPRVVAELLAARNATPAEVRP